MATAPHLRLRTALLLVALVLGACSSGGGSPPSAAEDKARSADIVLTAADLPGLTQEEFPDREHDPLSEEREDDEEDEGLEAVFIDCLGGNALLESLGVGPRGNGSSFTGDDATVSVASLVVLAEKEEEAEQLLAGLSGPDVPSCLESAFRATYAEVGQATDVSVSDLPVDTRADNAVGFRIALETEFPPELSYLPQTFTAEMVFVQVDRGLAVLLTSQANGTFDDGERARLTDLLTARLRKAS